MKAAAIVDQAVSAGSTLMIISPVLIVVGTVDQTVLAGAALKM